MPGDRSAGRSLWLRIRRNGGLYLLMIPAMIIFICFTYLPMYGIVIAFKNFKPARGILGSEWAGLRYFKKYFSSYMFSNTNRNTLVISIYPILVTFPLPILIALMCNQMYAKRFKKFFQVSTYLPHFISTVVMCGMILLFLSPSSGVIPKLLGYAHWVKDGGVEEEWDAYLKKLDEMGLQSYVQIEKDAFAAYQGK